MEADMLRSRQWQFLLVFIVIWPVKPGLFAQQTTVHPLTIEELLDIKHPSNPVWSPDGQRIAFIWERTGVSNLYVVKADGSAQPTALTSFPEGSFSNAFWSHAGDAIYFPRAGDL